MHLYLYETYKTLLGLFLLGWSVWIGLVLTFILANIECNINKRHQKEMIIGLSILLIIGLLGTIFLPSTEVMKILLGLKP